MDDDSAEDAHFVDDTWPAEKIMIPAQFTHYFTGEPCQMDVNLVDYMGKDSIYLENKKDPLMAEHVRLHVFPNVTDDTNDSVRIISKHLMATCAREDGFALHSGYDRNQTYLVFKCKRGLLYKSRRQPTTPADRFTKIKTYRPLLDTHRCRFRFGFVYKDNKWFFNTGSGIVTHCFHARQQFNANRNPTFRMPKKPRVGDQDDEEVEPEKDDPQIVLTPADQVVQKACGMTKMQWRNGQEHWKDPRALTSQMFDFVWDDLCHVCDDSFHATAILQTHLARAVAECRAARLQDPGRKSLGTLSMPTESASDNTRSPTEVADHTQLETHDSFDL